MKPLVIEFKDEIWKEIDGYGGLYLISNYGNVMSYNHKEGRRKNPIVLKSALDTKGYPIVGLCKESRGLTKKIHRLVANAFVLNPNGYDQVNHIDGNKKNNHVNNLEWCTGRENKVHGIKRGIKTSRFSNVHFNKEKNKWSSSYYFKGKSIKMGYFDKEENAYAEVKKSMESKGIVNKYL